MSGQRVIGSIARVLICLSLILWGTAASGTSVDVMSDDDLVKLATNVVEGTVTDIRSDWNAEGNMIYTTVTLAGVTTLKGTHSRDTLELRFLGGRVGDVVAEAVGDPNFSVGEEVVLFLADDLTMASPVIGLFQGKVTIEPEPISGLRMAVGRGTRDEFVQWIKNRVAEQAGGAQ